MKVIVNSYVVIWTLIVLNAVGAVPVDTANAIEAISGDPPTAASSSASANGPSPKVNETRSNPTPDLPQQRVTAQDKDSDDPDDLDTAATEDKDTTFIGTVGSAVVPDNDASASDYDTSYGAVLSPDALHHYLNSIHANYLPYPPYPAPVGYGPPPPPPPPVPVPVPVYPSPYVLQTGYEGYLVPATTTDSTTTTTTTAASTTAGTTTPSSIMAQLNPFNLISQLLMSTLFRIIATVVSALGMIFFSGAITSVICNFTPLCDVSYKAVTYLKRHDTAERVGRMIADGMTPERMRRATEFVRKAIRKYQQLQDLMGDDNDQRSGNAAANTQ